MSLVPYLERNTNSCYNCKYGFSSPTLFGGEQDCLRLYNDDKKPTKKQIRKIKKALLRIKHNEHPPKCKLYERLKGIKKVSINQKVMDFIKNRDEIPTDE